MIEQLHKGRGTAPCGSAAIARQQTAATHGEKKKDTPGSCNQPSLFWVNQSVNSAEIASLYTKLAQDDAHHNNSLGRMLILLFNFVLI